MDKYQLKYILFGLLSQYGHKHLGMVFQSVELGSLRVGVDSASKTVGSVMASMTALTAPMKGIVVRVLCYLQVKELDIANTYHTSIEC